MQGIILAAGMGKRLKNITKNIQLCVAQNRMIQADHFAMTFAGCQDIHADCPDVFS
jgi:dTDP-glucose pyrophosphorylase